VNESEGSTCNKLREKRVMQWRQQVYMDTGEGKLFSVWIT